MWLVAHDLAALVRIGLSPTDEAISQFQLEMPVLFVP